MTKKKIILGIIILIALLAASQWVLVKMVYAKKLTGGPAYFFARAYNLQAGSIIKDDSQKSLKLSEFFNNQKFVLNFLKNQKQELSQDQIDAMIWERLLKNYWLAQMAQEANLEVSDSDIDQYLAQLNDAEELRRTAREDFGVSFDEYKNMVIKPVILEDKVYTFLLDNYNDMAGINKAQDAYEALEGGQDFSQVAGEYSDDMTYVDSSFYLNETELIDFYEPISRLKAGEFSKIITLPGAYIIWKVESINESEGQKVYEVKGIFIAAKTIDSFFEDFIATVQVDKTYN